MSHLQQGTSQALIANQRLWIGQLVPSPEKQKHLLSIVLKHQHQHIKCSRDPQMEPVCSVMGCRLPKTK